MGLPLGRDVYKELTELRLLYEPYLTALADRFVMPIPGWFPTNEMADNWQTTAWPAWYCAVMSAESSSIKPGILMIHPTEPVDDWMWRYIDQQVMSDLPPVIPHWAAR